MKTLKALIRKPSMSRFKKFMWQFTDSFLGQLITVLLAVILGLIAFQLIVFIVSKYQLA